MCALSVYLQLLIAIYSSPIYFCRSSALWSWTDSKICDSGIELTRKFGTDCWRLLELNRKSWTDSRSSHGLLVLELKREAPDERGTSRKELDAEWNAHAACLRGAAPCYLLPLPYYPAALWLMAYGPAPFQQASALDSSLKLEELRMRNGLINGS
jgi:hypothetical protein